MMRDNVNPGGNIDARFRDKTGREHYDNGRFSPVRSGYDEEEMRGYYDPPYMGYGYPVVRGDYVAPRMDYPDSIRMGGYEDEPDVRRSWRIIENNGNSRYYDDGMRDGMRQVQGFGGSYVDHPYMDEMSYREGVRNPGHASSRRMPILSKEMAEEWMEGLQNADGTHGPHWTMEDVKKLLQQKGMQADPLKIWVAMNAEYSDAVAVNRKFGVDNADFYLESAIARWLNDKDAVPDKPAAYYTYIVRH